LTTDAKENVICNIISKSIFIFEGSRLIYNFDISRNLFVPLLSNSKSNLRVILKRFVCTEMERFARINGYDEYADNTKKISNR
jgi:hypothetical protein